MAFNTQRLQFAGHSGAILAARLDLPNGPLRAYALFAHCFTCSKDLAAVRRIAAELAREGIAVLRFDFTGLGSSEGEFASTNFSSNVADLLSAADYLRQYHQAPSLLIGHSLGGAAVLAVAKDIPEVRAVATIGAPGRCRPRVEELRNETRGDREAGCGRSRSRRTQVPYSKAICRGRACTAYQRRCRVPEKATPHPCIHRWTRRSESRMPTKSFLAARHPKSFVSLDKADHLLTNLEDAAFAGRDNLGMAHALSRRRRAAGHRADRACTRDGNGRRQVSELGSGWQPSAVRG